MFPESKLKILKDRSLMLKKVRSFFYKKKILETDTPILVKKPTIDLHIASIKAYPFNRESGYLHTSPEYLMKRLIAKGLKDIYFLGHCFRKNEAGQFHNIEFTMIEWYKSNTSFDNFLKDNVQLLKLFVKFKTIKKISYFDILNINFKINFFKDSKKNILNVCKNLKINFANTKTIKKIDLLNLLLNYFFEKIAKKDFLYIVHDFPKEEAALAQTYKKNDQEFAKRFEFFLNGFELANGYCELNNEEELKKRFEKIIKKKKSLSLDEKFLKSVNHLGVCFGIAIGFDRLMMLKHKSENIKDVLYFSYSEI